MTNQPEELREKIEQAVKEIRSHGVDAPIGCCITRIERLFESQLEAARREEQKRIGEWLLDKTAGGYFLGSLADHLITGQELDEPHQP